LLTPEAFAKEVKLPAYAIWAQPTN
jgi:hypothetical protein